MRFFILVVFSCCSICTFAQVLSSNDESYVVNTHYYLNPYLTNAAYAGNKFAPNFGITTKDYKGLSDRGFNHEIYLNNYYEKAKSGLGFFMTFFEDTIGQGLNTEIRQTNIKIGASASYTYALTENTDIILGFAPGIIHYRNTRVPATFNDPTTGYQIFPQRVNEALFKMNLDIGILIESKNYFIAAAMHHINEPEFMFYTQSSLYRFRQETILNFGFNLWFNDIFKLTPNATIQNVQNNSFGQYELRAEFNDLVFASFAFKNDLNFRANVSTTGQPILNNTVNHNLGLTAGIKLLDKIRIAASVDLPTGETVLPLQPQFEFSAAYFFRTYKELF